MIAYSISLPPGVQAQVTSFAAQYGVDSLVASAVAQVSSGGQQFYSDNSLVVTAFGVGVMGIGKEVATALGLDAETQAGNIQAGVATLAALLPAFAGNYSLALAAYVTSVPTVQQFNGIPPLAPVRDFVYNVSKLAALGGSVSVSSLLTIRNDATADPTAAATTTGGLISPLTQGTNYGSGNDPATSASNLSQLQSSVSPVLQVPDPTLSNTPWYADSGLVTGNPRIRASVQPVTFMVFLDRNTPQYLKNPADGSPIELQLNTSLSSFEIASKHVYNRTPSRTGMHITLWGMEPDLISGQGTTGVFMNQFGITDFMSVVGVNQDIVQLLTEGFSYSFLPTGSIVEQQSTGEVTVATVSGTSGLANNIIASQNLSNPNEAFRVAAQDAFIEFLKLFQMNGNVWYYNTSYATGTNPDGTQSTTNLGTIGGTQQASPNAWSPTTGTTSLQQHSRNNDVMTRGYVAMRYRNNVYLGYFKSLSWTQDAESPFQWKFNFSFQVERTYTALYFPQPGVTQPQPTTAQGA